LRGQLESAKVRTLEIAPTLVEPRRIRSGDERPHRNVLGDPGGDPGGRPVLVSRSCLGAVNRGVCRLHIDPRLLGEDELELATAFDSPGADGAA
jgi:hypothetical protein